MTCKRGKANPDSHTKLRLFADSAGYCQNPDCNTNLFLAVGETEFHIAEMAHIISAGDDGPRSNQKVSKELKGDFTNLILLCPTCHTKIDKAELEFPKNLILTWKLNHSQKLNSLFNIKQCNSRSEVRQLILPMLNENRTIFEIYGPLTDERFNPESEMPKVWKSKIHQIILPNNRKLLAIFDKNYNLLQSSEAKVVELFRQHVLDFEARHINNQEINGLQFPNQLNDSFIDA
ncbi:hypothetical protein [Chitinophaga eiseniae]|uniref:HNH endonuclease n=1 Tax=Chitinophaga eiseniae TaxID=634771 RepID=A0A847SRS4_9BACT|nr:hypothetical protein [Chitinophaga eiseniae]NLR82285.1 hypothetical protein [Chitinophaga eiseniae]